MDELHQKVAKAAGSPIIVFNGELDRIRSGYYPPFVYPKLGRLAKSFIPHFEPAYYIHNFKGSRGGKVLLEPTCSCRSNDITGIRHIILALHSIKVDGCMIGAHAC